MYLFLLHVILFVLALLEDTWLKTIEVISIRCLLVGQPVAMVTLLSQFN